MVGGVEIAVDLNYDGIEQTLKELDNSIKKIKGIDITPSQESVNNAKIFINKSFATPIPLFFSVDQKNLKEIKRNISGRNFNRTTGRTTTQGSINQTEKSTRQSSGLENILTEKFGLLINAINTSSEKMTQEITKEVKKINGFSIIKDTLQNTMQSANLVLVSRAGKQIEEKGAAEPFKKALDTVLSGVVDVASQYIDTKKMNDAASNFVNVLNSGSESFQRVFHTPSIEAVMDTVASSFSSVKKEAKGLATSISEKKKELDLIELFDNPKPVESEGKPSLPQEKALMVIEEAKRQLRATELVFKDRLELSAGDREEAIQSLNNFINTIEKNVKSFDTKGLKVNGKNFNQSINATMSRLKQMRGVVSEQQDGPKKEEENSNKIDGSEPINKGINLSSLLSDSMKSLDISSFQAIGKNIVDGILNGVDTSFLLDIGKTIGESLVTGIKTILQINSPSKVFEQIGHYIVEGLSIGLDKLSVTGDASFSELRMSIKVWTDKIIEDINNAPDNFSFFYKNLTENLDFFLKKTQTKVKRFIRDFPVLLTESFDKIEPALLQLDKDIDDFFSNLSIDSVKEIGANIIKGIMNGIEIPLLQNIGNTIGEEITESTKDALQINSPSKVFEQIGSFLVDGLKKGFSENISVFVSEIGKDLEIDPKKLLAPITALFSGEIKKSLKGFRSLIKTLLSELTEDVDNFIKAHIKTIVNNVSKEIPVLFSELQEDLNTIGGSLRWLFLGEGDDFKEVGANIAKGVKEGVETEGIDGLGKEIGDTIVNEAKDVLDINSPSGVFKWIGEQIVKGLSVGTLKMSSVSSRWFDVSDAIKKADIFVQKIKNKIEKTGKKISLQIDVSKALFSNKSSFGQNSLPDFISKMSRQTSQEWEKMLVSSGQLDKALVTTENRLDSLYKSMDEEIEETAIKKIRDEIEETLVDLKEIEDQRFNIQIKATELNKIDEMIHSLSRLDTVGSKTKEQIKEIEDQIKSLQSSINGSIDIEMPDISRVHQQEDILPQTDGITELPSLLQGIIPLAGSLAAIFAISRIPFLDEIKSFAGAGLALSIEFQSMSLAINFLEGSAEKGTKKIKELKSLSNEMGVSFKTIGKGYKQLAASTRNTSLEGKTTDDLTKSITQAGRVFGMTSDEIEGSFLAVSQMAGKGSVSAEELRGQLAERIPGAFQIAARAMKMTEKELFQLMATGNMASTTFLPAFAKQLDIETKGGLSGGTKSLASDIERFNTALTELQITIGSVIGPIHQLITKMGTVALNKANETVPIFLLKMPFLITGAVLAMGKGLTSFSKIVSVLMGFFGKLTEKVGLTAVAGRMSASLFYKGWAVALATIGKMLLVFFAKTALFTLSIEIGIGIFKQFQAEFGKSTVYDQWANNIESNVDRVNEAIKTSLDSMTALSNVKPSNQIASSGNWWLEMGENALGLVGMDSRSRLDKAVKKANEKRAKEGKAPVSQEEIGAAIDALYNIDRSQLGGGARQRDKAIIEREKLSRIRDENFYNPIQQTMEQYKFGKSGPLAEIEKLEKKIKGLKAQQAVLDPADVETAQKLTKEIGLAEKAKQDLLGPLDAQESGLRQALKDDQEKLDKYNQAILDQNSDDKEKRKAAEAFLRTPGHDPQSMSGVARDIDQTTKALNLYQQEQAKAGAFNNTKKLAMAMMELGFAFASVEKRINAINASKLKEIAQLQVKGFSTDQFNDTNTGLRTAEEQYNNTQRLLKERKAKMKELETNLALNPTKTAADQLIGAEEEKRGRKLTSEEVNMLAELYAKEGQEQLKQALTAEATLRDERLKNLELEKQSVDDIYNIRQARQAHYLAIYEDAIDEIKQLDQRNLSNATTGANNQLARGLRSDLGAEDKFNVKTTGMQYIKVQKDIENNALAMKSLKQAYFEGKLSLEQYTTKSRALLTEDAQLKQQLVEQEISYIRAISQARMNALQRIKESRDANTEIANSGRTKAITKSSISKFRTDEFLTNNESLAQAKNGLVEVQNQLKNTKSELSELEEAYAGGKGPLLLNEYIQKKRQLLITQAQQESQLTTAEMARMRAIEDYRLAMLDRMRDVSNNKNAILNAEALTQLAQSQMSGQVSDSTINRQSAEIGLDNAKKAVDVAQDSLSQVQKAFAKKELSAEKYQERLRTINLEIAQANQSVAEQELAVLKANEQEKISIIEKSLEKQDRLNKLNAIKAKINNPEQLSGMLVSGGTSDLTSSIFNNQETNTGQDQQITSLTSKLVGMKGILNPTKDLQDKILATEQELNEAVLTKRLNLLSQSLEYKKQMLNATQLENKAIENQLNVIDSQHKIQQALVEITKKRLENEIVSMERVKTLSDEIGSSSIESVKSRSQFDDAIASKRLKTLGIELKANVRNLEIEQQREILGQRKAENESRLAVLQAKNTALIANQSGNSDAIALAQQQLSLANESLSVVLQQGQSMSRLHDTQRTKLALEHKGTLEAEKYAKIQDTINSKLKTANSYLDKQKERLDSINELNKAINSAKTNVLEKRGGIIDRGIDLFDQINGTEKVTDPAENPILMKELQEQLKANTGIDNLKNIDPKKMYSERLRLEETLANQKMDSLLAEQNMQKTLLQIEFDKLQLQGEALLLQAKMLALQAKGTENEADANQAVKDATSNLTGIADRRKSAESALGVNQSMERYNQEIDNANAINETRRRSAEAGYKPEGDPAKYPGTPRFAGKSVDELLAGEPKRFGYAPSFDLNREVEAMLKGGSTDNLFRNIAQDVTPGKIDIANIPETQEATYQPLDLNNELLIDANDATRKNTTAMQDLITALKSVVVPEGQPSQNTTPKATPEYANNPVGPGGPTGPGIQQNTTNVNYGGVTIISSDPTGDARKVLTDLAKANKNRF